MSEPSDPTWAERFSANYDRLAARKRQQWNERRLRRRAPASGQSPRLIEATQRIEARHADAKAKAEASPYWVAWAARRRRTFMDLRLWTELRAHEGDPDARRVWRYENADNLNEANRKRKQQTAAAVGLRLIDGFTWPGGPVGGNSNYQRQRFTYDGLVSDEHPLLRLFVTKVPRRKNLRTGRTKSESNQARSKLLALDDAYIESNAAMRGVLRVELDKVFRCWDSLRDAIAAKGVPLPNLAVGYADPSDGRVHRPHLFWLIEASVAFTQNGRTAPQRLFSAILKALTVALLRVGADPGGLTNSHRHKNPLSPLWGRQILTGNPYTLDRLRDGLSATCPLEQAGKRLKAITDRRNCSNNLAPVQADHPHPDVAAQSNQVFAALSKLARSRIGWHRDEGHGSPESLVTELQ